MVNGKKIKELIERLAIDQKEFADRVGITPGMMSYIINGLKTPSVPVLNQIAKKLGVTMDELMKEE